MRSFIVIVLSLLLFMPAYAQAPTPSKKDLAAQAKTAKGDLKSAQKKMVKLAASIQENESELQKLDTQMAELEADTVELREELQEDQKSFSDLVMALQRIRRLPPEALVARPDAPLKTAQSAMLMQNMLPGLYEQAERLKNNLAKMETLESELKDKREKLTKASKTLQAEHVKLSSLVQQREKLYRKTQTDLEEREKRAKKIASRSRNVGQLVDGLKKYRQQKSETTQASSSGKKTPIPTAGQPRLPISGVIKVGFNEPDNFGAPNQGIDIEGRGGALVVAPMGGVIRFSGPFRNYGNMVIIEHKSGYHSLVAGLEKLDVAVGQGVAAGEPLGLLHYEQGKEKPVLYYELRYNGKAVNPAKKISGL